MIDFRNSQLKPTNLHKQNGRQTKRQILGLDNYCHYETNISITILFTVFVLYTGLMLNTLTYIFDNYQVT
jgi:hypothetical protein